MNWKQFLKPIKTKMILFINLSFLTISYFIWDKLMRMGFIQAFIFPPITEMGITPKIITNELLVVWVIQIIFILIFNYLLSCFLFWIRDKRKKK